MWHFKNKQIHSIEELSGGDSEALYGFVYVITNLTNGRIYVGKKNFFTQRKKNLLKSERSKDKRRKNYRIEVRESNWKEYWGSCEELHEDMKTLGERNFRKDIVELAHGVKHLSYLELKHQILNDVLCSNSYNGNILGKYYIKDICNETTKN
jgi:hypothetical protein